MKVLICRGCGQRMSECPCVRMQGGENLPGPERFVAVEVVSADGVAEAMSHLAELIAHAVDAGASGEDVLARLSAVRRGLPVTECAARGWWPEVADALQLPPRRRRGDRPIERPGAIGAVRLG